MSKAAFLIAPATVLAALMATAPAGAATSSARPGAGLPDTALFERAFMLEADRRCTLFTPEVRAALRVAAAQARASALRSSRAPDTVELRARAGAGAVPCASPDLRLAAARVRSAHEGWTKVQRFNFQGDTAGWRADRTPFPALRWRLVQTRGDIAFGLAGEAGQALRPYAVARFPKRERPALVRLTVGRQVFLAETNAPAPQALEIALTQGVLAAPAWVFRFPAAATAALDAAGPHDPVRLDFVTPGRAGDRAMALVIERGDYPAARAFIRLT